jgi:UDP-N-acetyl-2-amino-2-deoxyglucuronate dehydrogenase
MTQAIHFGVIGYGNIGKRHARHIMAHLDARLTAICDNVSANFEAIPQTLSYIPRFNDYRQVLTMPEVEVVNICTPNFLHAPMTIAALEAGKHVVCEKPMAISSQDCAQMIAAAAANDRKLFVVKQNRYNPPIVAVKELLDKGILGQIYQVQINCFWNRNDDYYQQSTWRGRKILDGGCLFTQCSHFIDILYYLIGDVQCINGLIENKGHQQTVEFEDSGVFILQAKQQNALIGFSFSTNTQTRNMEGSITIIAQKGTVKIGGQYLNTIEYQDIAGHIIENLPQGNPPNDYGTYKGSMSNHDKVIANVVDTLHGKANIATNGNEGKRVVEIIEEMYAKVG